MAEDVRMMSAADYLTWSWLAALCAAASGQLFVDAERRGALGQAWLSATAFFLWSALAAVCFWGAA